MHAWLLKITIIHSPFRVFILDERRFSTISTIVLIAPNAAVAIIPMVIMPKIITCPFLGFSGSSGNVGYMAMFQFTLGLEKPDSYHSAIRDLYKGVEVCRVK